MHAFLGQFDRISLGVFTLGAAIGVVWLVALDLGIALAAVALVVGSVTLIVHHRWIEIALLMIGIGLIVQTGYAIVGVPPEPPIVYDPNSMGSIAAEAFAPGMAGVILVGGVAMGVVVGVWDVWEGRRRERLDRGHRRRRAQQLGDSEKA